MTLRERAEAAADKVTTDCKHTDAHYLACDFCVTDVIEREAKAFARRAIGEHDLSHRASAIDEAIEAAAKL